MKRSLQYSSPLVSLELIKPFVSALRDNGVDPETVLETVGLTLNNIDQDDTLVHVKVVDRFVENCAKASKDQTFCAKVAARFDFTAWPLIMTAFNQARTLGDFLFIYVVGASKVAPCVTPFVEVRGNVAIIGETRRFDPSIEPAQNDAFMISLNLAILKYALGSRLDPEKVQLVLCAPDALPSEYDRYEKLTGGRMGPRVRFPADWLLIDLGEQEAVTQDNENRTSQDFLQGFRTLLRQSIGNGSLKVEDAAALVQMKPKTLGRRLAALGTSAAKEIGDAKMVYAQEALTTTSRTIADIAASLGYVEPSNFTRAFTKQIGKSPTELRTLSKRES